MFPHTTVRPQSPKSSAMENIFWDAAYAALVSLDGYDSAHAGVLSGIVARITNIEPSFSPAIRDRLLATRICLTEAMPRRT